MQLQFSKSAVRCLGTVLQDVRTAEATQELRLTDGMPDIGRVLITWGQIQLRSKEWQGSTVLIGGGVLTWTLYAPEDGTEPRCVESWLPFQMKWELPDSEREGTLVVQPLLRFADSRSLSSRKMIVRAGVSVQILGLYQMEADLAAPPELPEDVQILKRTYPVRLMVESGEKTFMLDEEVALPDVGHGAEKLLGVTVNPRITEKKVLTNRILFKGMLDVHLVYRDSDGRVRSSNLPVAFSQLAELDRSYSPEAQVDIRMAVTGMEADLDQGKLRLKCSLVGQYLVDDRQLLELAQDAYSPFRQVELEMNLVRLPVILEDRCESATAEHTLPGQHGQAADAVFLPDYPRMRYADGGVEMELPGMFQGLFYDENDTLQGISNRWEGKLTMRTDEGNRIRSAVSAGEVQTMTSVDGLVLSAPIFMDMRATVDQEFAMLTGLTLGENREADAGRPSLILRSCGGESLWDLAKSSGSTVGAIQTANGLVGEPTQEQMLLIPVV